MYESVTNFTRKEIMRKRRSIGHIPVLDTYPVQALHHFTCTYALEYVTVTPLSSNKKFSTILDNHLKLETSFYKYVFPHGERIILLKLDCR